MSAPQPTPAAPVRPSSPENTSSTVDYAERVRRFRDEMERLTQRSNLVSNLRGSSFGVFAIAGLWAIFGTGGSVPLMVCLVGGCFFVVLLVVHARVIRALDNATRWVRVNEDALARQTDGWRDSPNDGEPFKNPLHPYAADLDLFGKGSLFQRMCVAQTLFGQQRLAAFLMNRADREEIQKRQKAAAELVPMLELRQELEALALAVAEPTGAARSGRPRAKQWLDPEPLLGWAEGRVGFLNNRPLVWVAFLAPPITLAWIAVCQFLDYHPIYWLGLVVLHALVLMTARNHSARVFAAVSSTQGEFLRFGPMLRLLETLPAEATAIVELKERVKSVGGDRPSVAMRRFERIVGWFEVRHNGLVYPFINLFLLWDVHCVVQLERWQLRSGKVLRQWFQALGELEALSSLASFASDNPDFCWPELSEDVGFEAETLAHPLLSAHARVPNDIEALEPGTGLLVTGSNMSGKSTLLRAMGINVVLALCGAPVCAKRLKLCPMAVRTSMRISDSLHQGVSHFYAELRTLKSVLDASLGSVPVFFLLDEILHGTNSRERQIGARWVLRELLQRGAMGAVSTHDEGLCELPQPLAAQLRQVHFRETVEGEEMTFDYRLRPGPVTSGNALRLMRSMGIAVSLD